MVSFGVPVTSLLVYCLTSPHLFGGDINLGSGQAVGVHVHTKSSQGLKVTCLVNQLPGKAVQLYSLCLASSWLAML